MLHETGLEKLEVLPTSGKGTLGNHREYGADHPVVNTAGS
jgi:hypothetical protein